ncbi:MAG: hypothetical protein COW66_13200 [Flavobacteriaceae bacterium CG18_big_fil_WC_8_21_14_2_50_34_36]|nr:hypothetical protein [Flavobacteriia bacterium]NCT17915.1 hypothetical protein [Flavobacteriia bacterium]PIQ17167.1 MAG: hypothetical protein COW66_13200 [Flavobacteriaceae bacterium CG18_big_fil_WC_8_21_14_2_50_34_36]
MKTVTFTRQELYKLVWEKPLTHIAKELGYSDNDIRKVCIKHNIPLPKAGYWSKLKHNKKVKKSPLPKTDDQTTKINFKSEIDNEKGSLHSELSRLKQNIAQDESLNLTVPENLLKPDPLIKSTKAYYKELKSASNRNRNFYEERKGVISISVSNSLFSRAIRFMDSFVKLFKKRGHQIIANRETKIVISGEEYEIRLTEKHKRVKNTSSSYPEFELIPTGFLCLKLDYVYPDKQWSDTATKPIEEKLTDILAWFEIRAEKDRIERIERDIQHKIWEEERKKEAELKQLQDQEFSKFQTMFDTATRWHKSQYIRNYIKEFEAHAIKTNSLDNEKIKWIQWANEKADWYDPFIEKQDLLLDNIDRATLTPKKTRYW